MSKQLHTTFIIPTPARQAQPPVAEPYTKQQLQDMITEMKSYWQEAAQDLLQPRNEVMQRLFGKLQMRH